MNVKLMKQVMNKILDNPKEWDQTAWHRKTDCGTTHCFAGWCQVLGGRKQDGDKAAEDAQQLFDISSAAASWLFGPNRTLSQLHGYVSACVEGTDPFNSSGYDSAGYDSAGYDRAGYDSAGYNRSGYHRAGYHRAGYDRAGYDRAGYDSAGYNRAGYDRSGYDRSGKILPRFAEDV